MWINNTQSVNQTGPHSKDKDAQELEQ